MWLKLRDRAMFPIAPKNKNAVALVILNPKRGLTSCINLPFNDLLYVCIENIFALDFLFPMQDFREQYIFFFDENNSK